jgi:hypothetical protein
VTGPTNASKAGKVVQYLEQLLARIP